MNSKTIVTVALLLFVAVSVVYLVVKETGEEPTAEVKGPGASVEQGKEGEAGAELKGRDDVAVAESKVMAYYFHGNVRCMKCRAIEAYTKEAIEGSFAKELKNGSLELRVVNIENPGNEHFVQDFQLVTRSVVLVEMQGDEQKGWKNLKQVWDLVGNKGAFLKYIQDETRAQLEGSGQ